MKTIIRDRDNEQTTVFATAGATDQCPDSIAGFPCVRVKQREGSFVTTHRHSRESLDALIATLALARREAFGR